MKIELGIHIAARRQTDSEGAAERETNPNKQIDPAGIPCLHPQLEPLRVSLSLYKPSRCLFIPSE